MCESDRKNLNIEVSDNLPIITLVGPTAIGKTKLSLQIAEEFSGEIVGVDSMQVYKFMDIGTAKPNVDEIKRVKHHLIDFVDPAEKYNVSRFICDGQAAVKAIYANRHIPIMTGGTGLYFKGFFEGIFDIPEADIEEKELLLKEHEKRGAQSLHDELQECDPESAERIHVNDTSRLIRALEIYRTTGKTWTELIIQHKTIKKGREVNKIPPLKIGLQRDRQQLYNRINQRVEIMIEQGLINEVEKLLSMGYSTTLHSMQSLGYRHILNFLSGDWSMQKTLELLARDTRRYAKRQLTWFTNDKDINWFPPEDRNGITRHIKSYITTHKQSFKLNS